MTAHAASTTEGVLAPAAGELLHRPARTGEMYWGPGDLYRFLVTGAESGGAYFVMEALVPPGGGPPPHIHRREDETFYVVDGDVEFLLGDRTVIATPGDFVNVPRGTLHRFHNGGSAPARLIVTLSPAGFEGFFEETLERVEDPSQPPPDNLEDVAARYAEAAPRYGLEFVTARGTRARQFRVQSTSKEPRPMQFFLTVPHDTAEEPTMASMDPAELEATMAAANKVIADMQEAGAFVFAGGLHPPSSAKTVDATDGEPVVVDGPFVEAPEYVGGFWIIEAADQDAAVRWAIQASKALGGRIEVRALQEVPDA